jgi:hypothetical protein
MNALYSVNKDVRKETFYVTQKAHYNCSKVYRESRLTVTRIHHLEQSSAMERPEDLERSRTPITKLALSNMIATSDPSRSSPPPRGPSCLHGHRPKNRNNEDVTERTPELRLRGRASF